MKKITLFFSLIFCLSLNAQVLTENFDALALPSNWTEEYVSASVDWRFVDQNQNNTVQPRNGTGMAAFWSNNGNGDRTRLVTPSLDISGVPQQVLTFYYTQEDWGGDQDELRIYYKTSAAGAWVLLAEFTADTDPNWTEVNLLLPNPSSDYFIAFDALSGWGRGVTIDDVSIDDAPNCLTPGVLSVFETSPTTADLNWVPTGSETQFDYEYGNPGFTVDSGAELGAGNVSGNSAGITGLTAGSNYEFYVRADCSGTGDGVSPWAGPFAWTQADVGESCGTAIAANLEPSCPSGSPITLDFSVATVTNPTSCQTFNIFGYWITFTTDALGGVTINTDNTVSIAIYDTCGAADIECALDVETSLDVVLSPNTQYYAYFWRFGTPNSQADICFTPFSPDPAPECAEAPITPVDTATDVVILPANQVTLNWTAPSSGPAPTDYELFFGTTSGSLISLGLNGNTDTFATIGGLDFSTTYYWSVVPYNNSTPATGPCAEWSFTTEAPPPPPSNDDCSGAIALTPGQTFGVNPVDVTLLSATADGVPLGDCDGAIDGPGVWYSVVVPADGNITIETGPDSVTNNPVFDTVVEVFSGTCGALTSVDCDDDGVGVVAGYSRLILSSLTPGETLLIRAWNWGGFSEEPFAISAYNATLSSNPIENESAFTYFPNPVRNELTIKAQKNIENVTVFNMLGQQVLRTIPNELDTVLDLNSLNQGSYFVKVTVNNVTKTVRIIKQ